MTTVAELLRDADPIHMEPTRDARERLLRRQQVLESTTIHADVSRRRVLVAAACVFLACGLAAAMYYAERVAVDVVAAMRFEVRLAEDQPAPGLREATIRGARRRIYLHEEVVASNVDIAEAILVAGGAPSTFGVDVVFTAEGATRILQATRDHLDRPLAVLIDGQVVMAPVVRSPISSEARITGDFSQVEAERIVHGILIR